MYTLIAYQLSAFLSKQTSLSTWPPLSLLYTVPKQAGVPLDVPETFFVMYLPTVLGVGQL